MDGLVALLAQPGDEALAPPVAVDVGRVDEVHPGVDRGVKRAKRFVVADLAPGAADGPGPEGDLGDRESRPAERAFVHPALVAGSAREGSSFLSPPPARVRELAQWHTAHDVSKLLELRR